MHLHDGTVIVPTGLRLTVGQSVTISGTNGGDRFEANEVDTPYDGADVGRFGFNVPPIGYPSYGSYGYGAFGGGYGYWNAAPFWPYGPAGWGPYGYGAFGAYGWPYGYSYGGGPYDARPRGRDDAPRAYHPSMRRSDAQERHSDQLPQVRPGQQMRIIESHPAAAARPPARITRPQS